MIYNQVRLSPRHLDVFASHATPALVEAAVIWQSKAAVEGELQGWNLLPLSSLSSTDLRNKKRWSGVQSYPSCPIASHWNIGTLLVLMDEVGQTLIFIFSSLKGSRGLMVRELDL